MEAGKVKRVLVVGAGTMGHSIAQVFAQADMDVNMVDSNEQVLDHAEVLMRSNLETLAEHGEVAKGDIDSILARIHPFVDLPAAAAGVDFAIEAVPELSDLKAAILGQLDNCCPEGAVLASNTSSLDVFTIATIRRPERLVVAHWFAPAHIIPLVEVVPGPLTAPETVAFTASLLKKIGKTPAVMKKFVPLFMVNRIQRAIIQTIYEILGNDWATPEELDLAVKLTLGVRLPIIGVVQSLDFTGLDLTVTLNKRDGISLSLIEDKVQKGWFGVKTSKGIYDYGDRTEADILRKRDGLFLKMLKHLEEMKAFEPV